MTEARKGEEARLDPNRLRGYRHARGITRYALAHDAGLTPTELDAIETRISTPTPTITARLAAILHCTPEDLSPRPGEPPNVGYWAATTATMPPLTPGEVAAVAAALDRIPTRRPPPDTPT